MIKYFLAFLALLYGMLPYDLVPDFAIGWGWIDDLIVFWLLWRFFKAQIQKQSSTQDYYDNYGNGQAYQNRSGSHATDNKTSDSDARYHKPAGPRDPYTVLNIEKNASPEEIKKAYRELAGKYHPDKVQHLGEEFRKLAEEHFKEIEEAYRKLMPK